MGKTDKAREAYVEQTSQRRNEVIRLYEEGKTSREIAEITHYSQTHVCKIIRDNNGESEYNQKMRKKEQKAKIIELYQKGMSVVDIAEAVGCKPVTVKDYIYTYKRSLEDIQGRSKIPESYGLEQYELPSNARFRSQKRDDGTDIKTYHWKLVKEHKNYAEFENQFGHKQGFTKGELIAMGVMRLRGE